MLDVLAVWNIVLYYQLGSKVMYDRGVESGVCGFYTIVYTE